MSEAMSVVLIVVSDRAARGERADRTAALLSPVLSEHGFDLRGVEVVSDDVGPLTALLRASCARAALVLTTGGTGVAARDVTPEATRAVVDLEVPGLGEAMRAAGARRTPHAWGSRALGGFCGRSLVVNLPGRPEGAVDSFLSVAPGLRHLIALRSGPVADASHEAPP